MMLMLIVMACLTASVLALFATLPYYVAEGNLTAVLVNAVLLVIDGACLGIEIFLLVLRRARLGIRRTP